MQDLADKFESVGMVDDAVDALQRVNQVEKAIQLCIKHHRWDTGIELATEYNYRDIEPLLFKYAQNLISQRNYLDAIQLYHKSNYFAKSCKWLMFVGV
jgi:hypothetical protein